VSITRTGLAITVAAYLLFLSGCGSSNVSPNAVINVTPWRPVGTVPLTVTFDASYSYDADGEITNYDWGFGDGDTGTGVSTIHTYQNMGEYRAQLTVTDNAGGTDTASIKILVATILPPYDDLMRYPSEYLDYIVFFRGKIIQVYDRDGGYVWRVATKRTTLGYSGDVIWVDYNPYYLFFDLNGSRFLEGDIVGIYGRSSGLRTYTSIIGRQVTVPSVRCLHPILIRKAGEP